VLRVQEDVAGWRGQPAQVAVDQRITLPGVCLHVDSTICSRTHDVGVRASCVCPSLSLSLSLSLCLSLSVCVWCDRNVDSVINRASPVSLSTS